MRRIVLTVFIGVMLSSGLAHAALTIDQPTNNTVTNDTTPALAGSADPDEVVTLLLDAGTPDEATIVLAANSAGNWFTFSPALAEGTHTLEASADDGLGGTESTSVTFEIDTLAPSLTISEPASASSSSNSNPTVAGTTAPDLNVDVYVNGALQGSATADASGDWSYTLPAGDELSDGVYVFEGRVTDAAGNEQVETVSSRVDTTDPTITIDSPAAGVTVSSSPEIRGTTEPGATVEVTIDGSVAGTALADSQGAWAFTAGTPIPNGSHLISAISADAAGNVSPIVSHSFDVDTTLPFVSITSPGQGSVTTQTSPSVIGNAGANVMVEISVDGTVAATVTADANGSWTYAITDTLTEGPHTVSASVTDNVQTFSADSTFDVDTTAPSLVVNSPAIGLTNTATPTVSGTSDPDATITILLPDGSSAQIVTDGAGTWSFVPASDQPEGPGQITVTAQDPAGNQATAAVDVVIDISPPVVVISNPDDNSTKNDPNLEFRGTSEPSTDVELTIDGNVDGTVTTDADGNWTYTGTAPLSEGVHSVTASSTDAAGNTGSDTADFIIDTRSPALTITGPAEEEVLEEADITVSGVTEPNQLVEVYMDGTKVGDVTADIDGNWSIEVTGLEDGEHRVWAQATDSGGNIANDEVTFTIELPVDPPPMGELTITSPKDGDIVNDDPLTITGTGVPGTRVQIFVDGVKKGEVTVGSGGTWALTLTASDPIRDGEHIVMVTAGSDSAEITVTTDTRVDHSDIIEPSEGEETGPQPRITGSTEPGASVDVFIDGLKVGATSANGEGDWSFTPNKPLEDGEHALTVTVTDEAGNSRNTGPVTFSSITPYEGLTTIGGGPATCSATPTSPGTTPFGVLMLVALVGIWRRRRDFSY